MFEITCLSQDVLIKFIESRSLCKNTVYDFTFERDFHICHTTKFGFFRYLVLDARTGYASILIDRSAGHPISPEDRELMIPQILFSIKYTGDRRYIDYRR